MRETRDGDDIYIYILLCIQKYKLNLVVVSWNGMLKYTDTGNFYFNSQPIQ